MNDHRRMRDSKKRQRINLKEGYEVHYWTQQFKVTEKELRAIVDQVGPLTKDVRCAINQLSANAKRLDLRKTS